jgi:chemotaxis methyl-accepting protein methylase
MVNASVKAATNILLTKLNITGFIWASKYFKELRKHVMTQAEAKSKKVK